jgi:hypothetical protein
VRLTLQAKLLFFLGAFAAIAGFVVWNRLGSSTASVQMTSERHPQLGWVACSRNSRNGGASTFRPMSDPKAASLVTLQREDRRYNARPFTLGGRRYAATNDYVPTAKEIRRFRRSRNSNGQTEVQFNPYFRYVDGRDHLRHPSTDDLIQWAAHKWGIPEDWLRAEYVQESYWNAFQLGDEASVGPHWYSLYPLQARIPHSRSVYQSLGITQVKWIPDGSVGPGTEPLRWQSTSFNIDYQAATVRFYFDNPRGARSSWGDSSYIPCQAWNSIGAWFEPYPWGNGGQRQYVGEVRGYLADREWTASNFVHWTPSSFPPGIRFR